LKEIQPAQGANQNIRDGDGPKVTRKSAAQEAGLSAHQQKTALRVASVPVEAFETAVESDSPPTVTSLAEVKTPQETKKILDVAAAEIYARRQQLGEEAITYAHAIKIEALAQLGALLKEMPKNTGAQGTGSNQYKVRLPEGTTAPKLSDFGISKKTSMIAQLLAALPEDTRQEIARQEKTITEEVKEIRREERRERITQSARPVGLHLQCKCTAKGIH
jgi:hypothetical protein